jgi:hypothetical protein
MIPKVDAKEAKEESKNQILEHRPLKDGKSLVGTPRYVSIHTHFGLE